jgi:hypothetical protein
MKILLAVMVLAAPVWSCGKNEVEYQGMCAAMPANEGANVKTVYSSEKPRRSRTHEWETGEANAVLLSPPKDEGHTAHDYQAEKNGR